MTRFTAMQPSRWMSVHQGRLYNMSNTCPHNLSQAGYSQSSGWTWFRPPPIKPQVAPSLWARKEGGHVDYGIGHVDYGIFNPEGKWSSITVDTHAHTPPHRINRHAWTLLMSHITRAGRPHTLSKKWAWPKTGRCKGFSTNWPVERIDAGWSP